MCQTSRVKPPVLYSVCMDQLFWPNWPFRSIQTTFVNVDQPHTQSGWHESIVIHPINMKSAYSSYPGLRLNRLCKSQPPQLMAGKYCRLASDRGWTEPDFSFLLSSECSERGARMGWGATTTFPRRWDWGVPLWLQNNVVQPHQRKAWLGEAQNGWRRIIRQTFFIEVQMVHRKGIWLWTYKLVLFACMHGFIASACVFINVCAARDVMVQRFRSSSLGSPRCRCFRAFSDVPQIQTPRNVIQMHPQKWLDTYSTTIFITQVRRQGGPSLSQQFVF